MAISDQIIRLQSAKIDMKSAISNFGVSVPDTTKLDEYGNLIRLITVDANAATLNSHILSGYVAYANGIKLTGTALSIATSALNNKIMNGYTAYANNGQLLTGNAFANATTATNARILKGYSAYLNNGTWLNGTMNNYTNENYVIGDFEDTGSFLALPMPYNGYYTTGGSLRCRWTNLYSDLGVAKTNMQTISVAWSDTIEISGLDFKPIGFVLTTLETEEPVTEERLIMSLWSFNNAKTNASGRGWRLTSKNEPRSFCFEERSTMGTITWGSSSIVINEPGSDYAYCPGDWQCMIWGV